MSGIDRADTTEHTRDARIGRVLDDFVTRRARGETVAEDDLLAAHADIADDLREHLAMLRGFRPSADGVSGLVAQGLLQSTNDERFLAELGPYKIAGVLGRGGMGVVLKAYEPALARTVALKLLRPEFADNPSALARFAREARATAALNHPNIVTVHAIGEHRGTHYLAMEYVAGPTLADLLCDHGPLPIAWTREIFRQLLVALEAAHAVGLIHRDVKPSNILVEGTSNQGIEGSRGGMEGEQQGTKARSHEGTKDGERAPAAQTLDPSIPSSLDPCLPTLDPSIPRSLDPSPSSLCPSVPPSLSVKLTDFGLARMRSSQTCLTLDGGTLGTPEYMSPEQARGDRDIDQRTDIYSAGVVLYEMLTGETPFRAETPAAVIGRVLHEDPPYPSRHAVDVDSDLSGVTLQMLEKEPARRLRSAAEAVAILNGNTRIERPRRRRRWRHTAARALVAVGALGITSALVTFWPRGATDSAVKHWNGHYYLLVPDYVESWTAARRAASARSFDGRQGRLATIESNAENQFLAAQLRAAGEDCYWVGGQRVDAGAPSGEGWEWITGERFGYTNWDREHGQPDNFRGQENYLELQVDGTWNDLADYWGTSDNKAAGRGYIVEFAP